MGAKFGEECISLSVTGTRLVWDNKIKTKIKGSKRLAQDYTVDQTGDVVGFYDQTMYRFLNKILLLLQGQLNGNQFPISIVIVLLIPCTFFRGITEVLFTLDSLQQYIPDAPSGCFVSQVERFSSIWPM